MRRTSLTAALLAVALARTTQGQADDFVWQEQWRCGGRIPITPRLLDAASLEDGELSGYAGDASLPPFLVLELRDLHAGVVLAVQERSGWIGIPIEAGHGLQGAYVVRGAGRALVFSMHVVEGPGHEYQILQTSDGFASASCSTLEFPAAVPSPESYLELVDFNVDRTGRGALIGFSENAWIDAHAQAERSYEDMGRAWYEYRTADGGRSFGPPQRIPSHPGRVNGIHAPLERGAALSALRADLRRSVYPLPSQAPIR